jgi:hypothetical protein
MGGSERTVGVEGSKGRASWKVTLSSRRWVLYRFGFPHPVLTLLGLAHQSVSRSHLFFSRAALSVFAFAEALALPSSIPTCAQPVHLSSPPFFSHANSNFEGNACIFPNKALSPRPPTLAPSFIGIPFLSSIPPVIPFFRALSPRPHSSPLAFTLPIHPPVPHPEILFLPSSHTHPCAPADAQRRRGVATPSTIIYRCLFPVPVPNSN